MADVDDSEAVVYAEAGSSWWPLLWGPVFAVVGIIVELFTRGPVHLFAWLVLAALLMAATAVWVYGRRRVCSVLLTPSRLVLGHEVLPVAMIADVSEVGTPVGAPVLGGGWTAPKGTVEVPVLLAESSSTEDVRAGRVLLAWARDAEALHAGLRSLLDKR